MNCHRFNLNKFFQPKKIPIELHRKQIQISNNSNVKTQIFLISSEKFKFFYCYCKTHS